MPVRVLAAEVADDGDVRLHLDNGAATPTGAESWRLDIEGGTWLLPGRVTLEQLAVLGTLGGDAVPGARAPRRDGPGSAVRRTWRQSACSASTSLRRSIATSSAALAASTTSCHRSRRRRTS